MSLMANATKNNCLPKSVDPLIPKSQQCMRKTLSTYFDSLNQWKVIPDHKNYVPSVFST